VYYWNKDNFEGLLAVANALDDIPQLRPLAIYCRLRERGLRRQALHVLRDFLSVAAAWKTDTAREFVVSILELHARVPDAHTFMTQPLWNELVFPVLDEWHATSPDAAVSLRWLGLLRRDTDLLRRTLSTLPNDVPVRRALVNSALSDVDFATHHLDETRFLGEVSAAKAHLAQARMWLDSAYPPESFNDLREELAQLHQMVVDWETFQDAPYRTFPEWCNANGRKYRWPTKFYYDTRSPG
jgi:hypothetical protein